MTRSVYTVVLGCLATALWAGQAAAQDPSVRVRSFPMPNSVVALSALSPNRAVIGVALSTGTLADTLGLEVTDVTADGPASAAGIVAGSRLQAINGVSLRISADDARDPATADAGYRRLQRELAARSAGDEVELRVLHNGAVRSVRVTTVAASALNTADSRAFTSAFSMLRSTRAELGLSVGSAENARDTLGLFITSVRADGPADSAGVIEGERIAAINGVDVRVPREDVGVRGAAAARLARFQRELARVAPGESVALRVFTNGRYREITLRADSASGVGAINLPMRFENPRFDVRSAPDGWVAMPGAVSAPVGRAPRARAPSRW